MEERRKFPFPRHWVHLVSLILALVGLTLLYLVTAKQVHISLDGSRGRIRTHAREVGSRRTDLNLSLEPADQISVSTATNVTDGMHIEITRARDVRVDLAGDSRIVRSASRSAVNVLADGGIRIYPGDSVWSNGVVPVQASEVSEARIQMIRLDQARLIDLEIDGSLRRIRSSAPTVGSALLGAGISIFEGDKVEPALNERVNDAHSIKVERARPVIIQMADEEISVQSAGRTVGEVLAGAGLKLSGMDYAVPNLEEPLPDNGLVRIVHVEEDVLVELEPIAFETVYQPVDSLELDQLQVQSSGTFGVQAERIRIRYEDGEEVNRSVEEAVTVVEPEPRVIGYGTKVVVRTLNTGSGTIEYWRAVPVYATSYSPCRLGVDRCGFVTAAGTGVSRGTIGVIRSWFNQMRGWPVFVPGYGPGSIQDIGAGFSDRDWIDLGFTDENYEAWHDWTTLYFLTPVPPLDQIPWILP